MSPSPRPTGRSNGQAVFITNLGRAYTVDIRDLAIGQRTGVSH